MRALNEAAVRFLAAGGMAVSAHGYLRFTKDADLVVELTPENVRSAFAALASAGYRPLVPITPEQFGDSALRMTLIRDKGMQDLQFWSERHRETLVDVFVEVPFDFAEEYEQALVKPLPGAGEVRFVSVPTLIRMKEEVGRPQDRIDVEPLRMLLKGDD